MATFQPAFNALMIHEGGYTLDPNETYRGVDRKHWPGWVGWPDIDRLKSQKDFPACLERNADLQGRVRDFYYRNFWTPVMSDLDDQALANWIFDKAVNMGLRQAYKLVQRALCLDEDGIIGPQTKAHIRQADPVKLVEDCRAAARKFYTHLALTNPDKTRFLQGWLARA